jgi:hypothetical protein
MLHTHALPRAHTHAHTQVHSEQDIFKDIFGTATEEDVTRPRVTRPSRDTSVLYACSKVLSLVTLYCKYTRALTFENFYRPRMAFVRAHIYISIYIYMSI